MGDARQARPLCATCSLCSVASFTQRPRTRKSGAFAFLGCFRTSSPATANCPYAPIEVFPYETAMTPIGVAIVIGIATIAGAIITLVIAPARAYADTNTDRTRADPHALRACRHRECHAGRSQKSDCKFSHRNLLVAAVCERNRLGRRS